MFLGLIAAILPLQAQAPVRVDLPKHLSPSGAVVASRDRAFVLCYDKASDQRVIATLNGRGKLLGTTPAAGELIGTDKDGRPLMIEQGVGRIKVFREGSFTTYPVEIPYGNRQVLPPLAKRGFGAWAGGESVWLLDHKFQAWKKVAIRHSALSFGLSSNSAVAAGPAGTMTMIGASGRATERIVKWMDGSPFGPTYADRSLARGRKGVAFYATYKGRARVPTFKYGSGLEEAVPTEIALCDLSTGIARPIVRVLMPDLRDAHPRIYRTLAYLDSRDILVFLLHHDVYYLPLGHMIPAVGP